MILDSGLVDLDMCDGEVTYLVWAVLNIRQDSDEKEKTKYLRDLLHAGANPNHPAK